MGDMDKNKPPTLTPKRLPLIRANHRNAYRSGEWARILGVIVVNPGIASHERCCYEVEFLDGVVDFWPIEDESYEYEFSPSIKDQA